MPSGLLRIRRNPRHQSRVLHPPGIDLGGGRQRTVRMGENRQFDGAACQHESAEGESPCGPKHFQSIYPEKEKTEDHPFSEGFDGHSGKSILQKCKIKRWRRFSALRHTAPTAQREIKKRFFCAFFRCATLCHWRKENFFCSPIREMLHCSPLHP